MLKSTHSDAEIVDFETANAKCYYPSSFQFLMTTKGLRPGMLIGMMGTTGSGKSTLTKSIIAEVAEKSRVLVWLSEESVREYQSGIKRSAVLLGLDWKTVLSNLRFIEEKSLDEFYVAEQSDLFEMFEQMIVESESDVVFIDNMSTSQFYSDEAGIKGQGRSSVFLSKITKKLNVTVFFVIHTSKNIHDNMDKLITKENVRGSQKLVIMAEYFYIIQKFTVNDNVFPILKIDKHRHHQVNKKFFMLGFDNGVYRFDKEIDFEQLNKIFIKRDQLGRKRK